MARLATRVEGKRLSFLLASLLAGGILAAAIWFAGSFFERVAASGVAVMEVRSDGLYHVSAADAARGLGLEPVDIPWLLRANLVQLSSCGATVPILPAGDGGFYFYGHRTGDRYSEASVYRLRVARGQQMPNALGPVTGPTTQHSFGETVHAEENRPDADMLFLTEDPNRDYLAWDLLVADKAGSCSSCSRQFEVRSDGPAHEGPASITAHLQGATASRPPASHDHHAVLHLNGTRIGEGRWDGETQYDLTASFDPALLNDGSNTVQVTAVLDAGVPASAFFVNSFDLSYQRYYRAKDNRLLARANDEGAITIDGFTRQDVLVLDITDVDRPEFVASTTARDRDGYGVSFSATSPGRQYLATAVDRAMVATPIAQRRSQLASAANGADYLIVAASQLTSAAEKLATYRTSQGLRTKVVDVHDVYDEFNYGNPSPDAVRAFLTYVHRNWRPTPGYVLLVGDGSFEYERLGPSGAGLLPVALVGTPAGLFPSDGWFADVEGDDGVPEMAIGRLPAATAEEVLAYVEKVKAYESALDTPMRALLMADRADAELDFASDSDAVGRSVPGRYDIRKVYLSQHPRAEARELAFAAIWEGTSLANYVGHGSHDRLAAEGLLIVDDVGGALDASISPVLTAMTCLTNAFHVSGVRSLGEELVLRKGGGATAVWAPSGEPANDDSARLDRAFYEALGNGPTRLGDAVNTALRSYATEGGRRWTREIYELLGDPALELR